MPQARAPATLLTTEVQIGGRPQRAIGQLTPQRLIHADAVATRRAQQKRFCHHPPSSHLGASRESPPLYAGRGAAHQGSPPACCGRLLKRLVQRAREDAPARASPSGDRLTPLPPSPRIRYHAAPSPHTITARSNGGKRPTAPRHCVLTRPSTADRRRPTADRRDGGRSAENAPDPPSEIEAPAKPALETAQRISSPVRAASSSVTGVCCGWRVPEPPSTQEHGACLRRPLPAFQTRDEAHLPPPSGCVNDAR